MDGADDEDQRMPEPLPSLDEEGAERGPLGRLFGYFRRLFWVVNAFELFERGAYYGTMAVMGYHVVLNLGISRTAWGAFYSFLIILLYFLPLAAAALADKFGYKLMLTVGFASMLVGYTSLSFVQPGQFGFLVVAFLFVGIGAGIFKPIISATIAHVTEEEKRNLAYSIYYWMINLGAMVFPFLIGVFFTDTGLYYYVFLVSTGLVATNVVVLFLFYTNPIEPRPELSVLQALKRIGPALQDRWFVTLLVIYSGFWFMFAYNHTFLPLLMVEFGRMPTWFTVPFLATINPGTIVILGPFLGKLVEKRKSLNVMMFGMVIFCVGFALNGMSNSIPLFVLGIIIFSIGEFIVHPGFISYVSKIAPKDKVAIYLACIFISTGLGQLVGGFVHGLTYDHFAYTEMRPQVYIASVIVVGLATLIAFMWYNRRQMADVLSRDPDYEVDTGIWTKTTTMVVAFLFIPVAFWGAYALGPMELIQQSDGEEEPVDWTQYDVVAVPAYSESDYSREETSAPVQFTIDDTNLVSVRFVLTWTDEEDQGPRYNNMPDYFSMEVLPPDADPVETPSSSTGTLTAVVNYEPGEEDPYLAGTGEWIVTVMCGACGEQVLWRPSAGLFDVMDEGNAWELEVTYSHYVKPQGNGSPDQ